MIIACILAGGNGTRLGGETPKQYLLQNGEPLFLHSVRAFQNVADRVVLVARGSDLEKCREMLADRRIENVSVVAGGITRSASSKAAIAEAGRIAKESRITGESRIVKERRITGESRMAKERRTAEENPVKTDGKISSEKDDIILIHDAARPFITEEVIRRVVNDVREYGAAVAAVPVKDTIKVAENGFIKNTPERDRLFAAQTPQGFRLSLLKEAYAKLPEGETLTDDAAVFEKYGSGPVKLSAGSEENRKITTKDDLKYLS